MYITTVGNIAGNDTIKKKSAKKNLGGFSELLSDSEVEESQASGSPSVNGSSQLLFMQEIGDEEFKKKEAVTNGFDALQYLDNIRMGLLCGTLSRDNLIGLEALLERFRKNFSDPQLSNILDEIQLRARVEIAKLARN